MSPTSYQTAPPRINSANIEKPALKVKGYFYKNQMSHGVSGTLRYTEQR